MDCTKTGHKRPRDCVGPGQGERWTWSKGRQGEFIGRAEQKTWQEMRILNIQLHPLRLPIPP